MTSSLDKSGSAEIFFGYSNKNILPREAHSRIGAFYHQIKELMDEPSSEEREATIAVLFSTTFGIDSADKACIDEGARVIHKLGTSPYRIVHSETTTSMFEIYLEEDPSTPFALFKIGRKRASQSILSRRVAHLCQLADYVAPSFFCAIKNPPLQLAGDSYAADEDPIEDEDEAKAAADSNVLEPDGEALWTGNKMKIFYPGPEDNKISQFVVGELQPFISVSDEEKSSLLVFATKTILSILIGLRDAKPDGFRGDSSCKVGFQNLIKAILVDLDDAWVTRNAPKDMTTWRSNPAALHLPFLADPQARKHIPADVAQSLLVLVESWSLTKLMKLLTQQSIDFADTTAETLALKARELDEGSCFVDIENFDHPINPPRTEESFKTGLVLDEQQVDACIERVALLRSVLRELVNSQEPFSILDIVGGVDPVFGAHLKDLENTISLMKKSPKQVSPEVHKFLRTASDDFLFSAVVGHLSPSGCETPSSSDGWKDSQLKFMRRASSADLECQSSLEEIGTCLLPAFMDVKDLDGPQSPLKNALKPVIRPSVQQFGLNMAGLNSPDLGEERDDSGDDSDSDGEGLFKPSPVSLSWADGVEYEPVDWDD